MNDARALAPTGPASVVGCPGEEELLAFVDGGLGDAGRLALDEHLDRCPRCFAVVAELMRDHELSHPDEPETEATLLPPGTALGRYRIQRVIGGGGMGVVYEAVDTQLRRRVAIKLSRRAADPEAMRRSLLEARAMATLEHPNVVPVYDVGHHAESIYIVMQLVEGPTLREYAHRGPRPWRDIVRLYVEAGRGLAAAHDRGVVHRDFKPHNVLVGPDGTPMVTDFGLALASAGDGHREQTAAPWDTRTGTLLGSPPYMSPEQHEGRAIDARSDQFSFCVALYEGVFGRRPFTGSAYADLRDAIVRGQRAPRPTSPKVPAALHRAIERGLDADAARRFPDMPSLLRALEAALKRRGRAWLLAGLVAAAGVVAFGMDRPPLDPACPIDPTAPAIATDVREAAGQAALRRVETRAARWETLAQDACTRHRETGGSASLRRELECLQRGRVALRTVATVLREGASSVEIIDMADGLPDPDACADARGGAPPTGDPVLRDALSRTLGRAEVLVAARRLEPAREAVADALRRARDLDEPVLEAEALLIRARLGELAGEPDVVKHLETAAALATAAGADAVAARGWIEALRMGANARDDDATLERYRRNAAAAVERAGGGDDEVALWVASSMYHRVAGRYDEALRDADLARQRLAEQAEPDLLARALAEREAARAHMSRLEHDEATALADAALRDATAVLGEGHPELSSFLETQAGVAGVRGDGEASLTAFRRLLANDLASLGAGHPRVARDRVYVAATLAMTGELEEARTQVEAALETFGRTESPNSLITANARHLLGNIHFLAHRWADAAENLERGFVAFEASREPDHPLLIEHLLDLGDAQLRAGQSERALAVLARADAMAQQHEHYKRAVAACRHAGALIAAGQPAEALARARRGIEALDDTDPLDRAICELARARAMVLVDARDRAEATAGAERARAAAIEVGDGFGNVVLADIEAWLEANP